MKYKAADFRDKTLTCVSCRQPFVWSSQQQADHALALEMAPSRRCHQCRAVLKAARARNERW